MLHVLKKLNNSSLPTIFAVVGVIVIGFYGVGVVAQPPDGEESENTESTWPMLESLTDVANNARAEIIGKMLQDSFPLWGHTFLVGKGRNEAIYPTFSKSIPTHLIKVEFPSEGRNGSGMVKMEYAILTEFNYKSTGHMINDVVAQFKERQVSISFKDFVMAMATGKDSIISITRRKAPDTVWTCDSLITSGDLRMVGSPMFDRVVLGHAYVDSVDFDTLPWNAERSNPEKYQWYKDKPTLRVKTPFDESKRSIYVFPADNFIDDTSGITKNGTIDSLFYTGELDKPTGYTNYCIGGNKKECYEYLPCSTYRVSDFTFWQVHFMPLVKFFPRVWNTGVPLMDSVFAMGFSEARERRMKAVEFDRIESPIERWGKTFKHPVTGDTTMAWAHYRRPFFADRLSCVISVQFEEELNGAVPEIVKTAFSKKDTSNMFNRFSIARKPDRMVRVNSESENDIEKAILRLYADSDYDDSLMADLRTRCGVTWRGNDILIGEMYRFPVTGGFGVWPSNVDIYTVRGTSKTRIDTLYDAESGEIVYDTVFVELPDVDSNYFEKRYIYNDCPCVPIPELNNFTASDLREFVFRTPPLCDLGSMLNAMSILNGILKGRHFTNDADIVMLYRRILLLGMTIQKKILMYATGTNGVPFTSSQINRMEAFCPKSWEINFRESKNAVFKPYRPQYGGSTEVFTSLFSGELLDTYNNVRYLYEQNFFR